MTDIAVARALHVLAIVLWIGRVALVTTVLLPALRRMPDHRQRLEVFEAVENRFGRQAKISIILAGLTGLYMLVRMDLWHQFTMPSFWWLHAMVLLWAIFALVLFLLEPLVLHGRFALRAALDTDAAFRAIHRFHLVLLVLSLLTILGAVAGSYGLLLFG